MNSRPAGQDEERETHANKIVVPIQAAIGLVITIVGMSAAGFGTSIWWASSISTKMDVVVKQGQEQSAMTMANSTRISALELWQRQLDAIGSPQMVKRTEELSKDLTALREEFNLHRATTVNGKQ